jgi:hypothetical protein
MISAGAKHTHDAAKTVRVSVFRSVAFSMA